MDDGICADLTNSRDLIFQYAGLTELHRTNLSAIIDRYAGLVDDHNPPVDEMRRTRKELAAYYYELYKVIFFKTMEAEEKIPTEVFMFLYFGYIDEKLAGAENAQILYKLSESMALDDQCKVFTFYQWLRLIYTGKKDPSVNEFSVDYSSYLREQKKNKTITQEEEIRLFRDSAKRVEYEIDNMFKSANKTMSTSVTTFCPFFCHNNVFKPLDQMYVDYDRVHKTIDVIRMLDFGVFFRETIYSNIGVGIEKEVIKLEVVPDTILMPVVGDRGSMWQEITGAKRTTPGRFLIPILDSGEFTKMMIKLCGEFRWELCRRIQGARWNDLSERSLTSDYSDYLATFRRNRDLSPEAREKIKMGMVKARSSSREMFAADYLNYMTYESQGAIRLNKVAREILFKYCPFCESVRNTLSKNPQYEKNIALFDKRNSHALHLYEISLGRLQKAGITIPEELLRYRDYLHR